MRRGQTASTTPNGSDVAPRALSAVTPDWVWDALFHYAPVQTEHAGTIQKLRAKSAELKVQHDVKQITSFSRWLYLGGRVDPHPLVCGRDDRGARPASLFGRLCRGGRADQRPLVCGRDDRGVDPVCLAPLPSPLEF